MQSALVLLAGLLLAPIASLSAAVSASPIVIIVMPDDVSHGDFTYYNPGSASKTPNIDRLLANSVRLTDFHVSPTCSPPRAALLTGRYNDVIGCGTQSLVGASSGPTRSRWQMSSSTTVMPPGCSSSDIWVDNSHRP